jgi:hypothetical protein
MTDTNETILSNLGGLIVQVATVRAQRHIFLVRRVRISVGMVGCQQKCCPYETEHGQD